MNQTLRIVQDLLAYTIWADRTVLDSLRVVSAEDLIQATGTGYGSIRGTLVHLLANEQTCLARFLGAEPPPAPEETAFPDRLSLALSFEEVWSQLGFFLASLSAEQLAGEVFWMEPDGKARRLPCPKAICHFVTLAAFHRGQAVASLYQMGYRVPETDYLQFPREDSSAPGQT